MVSRFESRNREANLSKALHWLNVSYSVWCNRKYRRVGPLFQGRFKAILHEPTKALKINRYIHLNPVRIAALGGHETRDVAADEITAQLARDQQTGGRRGALEALTWTQIVQAIRNVWNEPWEELLSADHARLCGDHHTRKRGSVSDGFLLSVEQMSSVEQRCEQWEVLRREEGAVIVGKDGTEKQLPLDQARNFSVFEREKITLSIGDRVRFTKNVKHCGQKFLNNELRTVVSIDDGKIIFDKGEIVRNEAALHLDQGIVVTSHASQAKTVDQVIASVSVRAFSQGTRHNFMSRCRARGAACMSLLIAR